jgi:hypothetical protein
MQPWNLLAVHFLFGDLARTTDSFAPLTAELAGKAMRETGRPVGKAAGYTSLLAADDVATESQYMFLFGRVNAPADLT